MFSKFLNVYLWFDLLNCWKSSWIKCMERSLSTARLLTWDHWRIQESLLHVCIIIVWYLTSPGTRCIYGYIMGCVTFNVIWNGISFDWMNFIRESHEFYWLSHEFHSTVTWISFDFHMNLIRLSHEFHSTVAWFSFDCRVNFTRLSHEFHLTVAWISLDCRMNFILTVAWISLDCRMNLIWLSREFHSTVAWISLDCRMNFIWLSREFHSTVAWISFDCRVNFTLLSHKFLHSCPIYFWISSILFPLRLVSLRISYLATLPLSILDCC